MGRKALAGVLAIFVLVIVASTGASAEKFTVGGNRGWIVPNQGLNYTMWAQNLTAHVNDSLYFKYNPNAHNVLRVNSTVFAACGTSSYLATWDTGDSTVVLEEAVTHYFICGAPQHCSMGQAFALDVYPAVAALAPSAPNSPNGTTADDSPEVNSAHPRSWLSIITINFIALVALSLFLQS